MQPLQAFLEAETSSAVILLAATGMALLWANSPFGDSYDRFWSTNLTITLGDWSIAYELRGWVSEGLMTLFFLVVGLEVKRELLTGELRQRRAAVLPVAAALGGMIVPAAVYVAFTAGSDAARGFGIAMPTDVVFALGVVALVTGLPAGLKSFLLSLAIVDDLGSIVVVAFVSRHGVDPVPLVAAVVVLTVYRLLWRINIRAVPVYVALGMVAWTSLGEAGVSPTLAGVALGFLTPAVAFQRPRTVSEEAHRIADRTVDDPQPPDADAAHWLYLKALSREAVSPLVRAEELLLPWTSYVVVPLFALASAGIDISLHAIAGATTDGLGLGIVVARIVGKPLGVVMATALALWLGAALPAGVHWRHVVGLAAAAGIPFTVALYIAEISLPPRDLDTATVAILVAAAGAGLFGFMLLRIARNRSP